MHFLGIFIATLIGMSSAALTITDMVRFRSEEQKCSRIHSVDPAIMSRIRAGENLQDPVFNCYFGCLFENMGFLNPDRTVNVDLALDKLPVPRGALYDQIGKIMYTCSKLSGTNECETGNLLNDCAHEQGIGQLLQSLQSSRLGSQY